MRSFLAGIGVTIAFTIQLGILVGYIIVMLKLKAMYARPETRVREDAPIMPWFFAFICGLFGVTFLDAGTQLQIVELELLSLTQLVIAVYLGWLTSKEAKRALARTNEAKKKDPLGIRSASPVDLDEEIKRRAREL